MKKNMNDFGEEKKHSFSKGESNPILPLETETELLLKKMERMQKKKNNYRNMDELENIYDTTPSKKEDAGFFTGFQHFLQNLDDIEKSMDELNVEGFDQEGMDDEDMEGMDDEDMEGFAQNLYSDMYEGEYIDETKLSPSTQIIWKKFKQRWPRLSFSSKKWKAFFQKFKKKSSSSSSSSSSPQKKSSSKKKSSKKPSKIRDMIKKIINVIKSFNPVKIIRKRIAVPTYYVISGEYQKFNSDVDVITTQIIYFIYSLIVVYISGNWFYLMCYRHQNKRVASSAKFYEAPHKLLTPLGIVGRNLRLTAQFAPTVLTNVILCEFFEQLVSTLHAIAVYPFYLIFSTIFTGFKILRLVSKETDFKDISKNYMQVITNPQLLFIIFTLFIMICIIKFSEQLHSMLMIFKNTKAKIPDGINKMLSGIILFDLFFGIKVMCGAMLTLIGMETTLTNLPEQTANVKNITIAVFSLVAVPLLFLIVFFIAIAVNFLLLRISGLLCVLYLYYYSYFGAYVRSGNDKNSMAAMFRNINDENPCNPAISNTLTDAFNKFINFIFTNLTFVVIICYSIMSIIVYLKKISNKYASGFLVGLNCIIIVFAIIASIVNSYKKRIDLRDYNYIEPYNK